MMNRKERENIPSRHSPQRLNTPISITLTLQQPLPRIRNLLPLPMQIAQCTRANLLRLERDALALSQPPTRPVQAIGAREELLALLELRIAAFGVVGVAVAEELGLVCRIGF